MSFPTPKEVKQQWDDQEAAMVSETGPYLASLAQAVIQYGHKPDADGWITITQPTMPIHFEKGTPQWAHIEKVLGNAGWEAKIYEGNQRDFSHELMIKAK
jgi:hypothetical protein